MQYVKCNICGINNCNNITTQNGYSVVECRQCGLVYLNPRPDIAELMSLYEGYHQRGEKDEDSWFRLMEKNCEEAASLLNKSFPQKGRLLDIGCGYGHFIEMMKKQGWSVNGIEPAEHTCSSAKSKGLDVSRTVIEDALFSDASFDAITAFYVLEHLCDPLSSLNKIRAMLKPGGMLVLRVPHTTPIVKFLSRLKIKNNLYDIPFHLFDFSPKTISLLLQHADFIDIKTMPGHPTKPHYIIERPVSWVSGTLARLLYAISGGKLLLPGVSKTISARKPLEKGSA
jgi:SAM-dependent methyltransferase